MQTDSYRHISDKSVIRTETTASFQIQMVNQRNWKPPRSDRAYSWARRYSTAVIRAPSAMDLQDFFENEVLEEGLYRMKAQLGNGALNKKETIQFMGMSIQYQFLKEIEHCLDISHWISSSTPNSLARATNCNIRLDKSLSKSDCNVLCKCDQRRHLPEGRLDIRMDMTVTSAEKGIPL